MREQLLQLLAQITISSARKKVYARKASVEKREDISRLLQAIAESESVQARRILSNLRGQIDNTEDYLTTVFADEIGGVIKAYESLLEQIDTQDEKAISTALSQLVEAERQTKRLSPEEQGGEAAQPIPVYYICQFCGYITVEIQPENCPICKAHSRAFKRLG